MNRLVIALAALLLFAPVLALVLGTRDGEPRPERIRPPEYVLRPAEAAPPPQPPPPAFSAPGETEIFREAANSAWAYVESQYQPRTGLVNSVINYPYATIWDIGSTLAAYHSAHELGLADQTDFDRRMGAALRTLRSLPLFDGAAFSKNYQVERGLAAGRDDRTPDLSGEGYGWSAMDLGRLLVWLRIVAAAHPQHAPAARAVVDRLELDRVVRDGYLWGASRTRSGGVRSYQEGRVGYEQYAAAGFALWDRYAERALDLKQNAVPVEVLGVPLFADRREGGHLTAEPFFLLGLEIGWWSATWEEMAQRVLAAQEARFRATGQLTMLSEDALPVAPHFFYYYNLWDRGREFSVSAMGAREPLPGPRWMSAKAAFAWYALHPGPYTWRVLQAVEPARDARVGWASGVYERNGDATGSQNINTAAVILEAALFRERRRPILEAARATGTE